MELSFLLFSHSLCSFRKISCWEKICFLYHKKGSWESVLLLIAHPSPWGVPCAMRPGICPSGSLSGLRPVRLQGSLPWGHPTTPRGFSQPLARLVCWLPTPQVPECGATDQQKRVKAGEAISELPPFALVRSWAAQELNPTGLKRPKACVGVAGGAGEQLGARFLPGCCPLSQSRPCWRQGGRTYSGGSFDPQDRKTGQNYCLEPQKYFPALLSPFPGPLCCLFNPTGTKHCP